MWFMALLLDASGCRPDAVRARAGERTKRNFDDDRRVVQSGEEVGARSAETIELKIARHQRVSKTLEIEEEGIFADAGECFRTAEIHDAADASDHRTARSRDAVDADAPVAFAVLAEARPDIDIGIVHGVVAVDVDAVQDVAIAGE